MIKRIPIKGISRDPSGQIAEDGMCTESLNVQLDMGEIAPMMAPKEVNEYGDISVDGDILYIHKGVGLGYENLICLSGLNLIAYKTDGRTITLYTYTSAPTIKSITHVGNTLIVSEGDNLRYFLFKDGTYQHLGTKIPVPAIWFGTQQPYTGASSHSGLRIDVESMVPRRDNDGFHYHAKVEGVEYGIGSLSPDDWSKIATKYTVEDSDALNLLEQLWGKIDENLKDHINNGEAIFPIFVRYAVRLYDDTLYACSVPILLGADIAKMIDVKLWAATTGGTPTQPRDLHWDMYGCVGTPFPYKIMADFTESQLSTLYDGWGDIVKSIDFFISDQIIPAARRNAIQLKDRRLEVYGEDITIWGYEQAWATGVIDPSTPEEELVTAHTQTYLVKSFSLSELSLHDGLEIWDDINLSADWILNQEPLVETYLSNHELTSDYISSYNNSLLLEGVKYHLNHGHPYHVSTLWSETPGASEYVYVFHVQIGGKTCHVFSRDPSGSGRTITGKTSDDAVYPFDTSSPFHKTYYEKAVSWIAYPDSRCFRVDVLTGTSGNYMRVGTHIMKPLSTSDVAYAFVGFAKAISNIPNPQRYRTQEDYSVEQHNLLIQSKSSNPFVVTPSGVVTLSGDIINIGMVTTPLSEGQAGQFHLYVFTSEGVFALTSSSTGELMYSHAVSRDILLDRNSIIGIEQAIFFASARGLMLLQGSSVTKVSELMDGKPDALSNDLAQDIVSRYFSGATIEETAPFYQFLNGCKMAYDYANARILLYREGQPDMYVYKFNTQSWHRMAWNPLRTPMRTLNSYPEAFIVETDGLGHQFPMNYSTLSEDPEGLPLPGLIYTRELSLDGIDIYKTINRLKIRGRYTDGHIKWALQGSNDGINFRTLHSLRGPSWKWYRIAIVSMLDAEERISYIELDYQPKFTNRLR